MDTLGPRIMVNVGTQAVTNPGLNPRDLAPLTNDAFLATFLGKTPLPTSNGISRQNNYRQPYGTQMDRVANRSKLRPTTSTGESIEPDSAILSVIRSNGSDNHHQSAFPRQQQGYYHNHRRSFHPQQKQYFSGWNEIPCSPNYRPSHGSNRQRRTRSGGVPQQITVVDQMAAQPHIPYAILPKRFEPKQVTNHGLQQQTRSSNNVNNHYRYPVNVSRRSQRQQRYYDDQWEDLEDQNPWSESMARRQYNQRPNHNFGQMRGFRTGGTRKHVNNYHHSYGYGSISQQAPLRSRGRPMYQNANYAPFNIVPTYDLNEWQGPYAYSRRSLPLQSLRNGSRRVYRKRDDFIHDDHRTTHNSSKSSRNNRKPSTPTTRRNKNTKSPKHKASSKRHHSKQHKQRNRNSKSEGAHSTTNTNDSKSTIENETKTDDDKPKQEVTTAETEEKPLPPREDENKETNLEKLSE